MLGYDLVETAFQLENPRFQFSKLANIFPIQLADILPVDVKIFFKFFQSILLWALAILYYFFEV